jgi:hypothetical protein
MPTAEQRHAMQNRASQSINHKMPPFPCNVLFYSKVANNAAFHLLRFKDQQSFDTA